MNPTNKLLDKYKAACSIASDNDLAKSLGVTRQAVSRWKKGLNHPEADSVQTMANAIGEDVAKWLPLIEAERARTAEARKVWLHVASRAASIAVATLIAVTTRMSIM